VAAKGRLNPFGDSSKDFVFFPSLSHKKGVHRIVRGLESNCGLILLTGEIGIGKTSLARHIQSYLVDRFVFVELGNPYLTPLEQMYFCCEKFGLDTAGLSSIHDCVARLERYFHEVWREGKRPVLVFDESHLLTKRHLSLIHILSNLRAEDGPLVQILLVGQLELLDLLGTEGMEALNQRIGVRCELSPLVLEDTAKYINFKLEKGGKQGSVAFSKSAIKRIWKESRGLPRLINHICAHALDGLAFSDSNVVSVDMVNEVCCDSVYTGMFQTKTSKEADTGSRIWLLGAGAVLTVAVLAVVWFVFWPQSSGALAVIKSQSVPKSAPLEAPSEQAGGWKYTVSEFESGALEPARQAEADVQIAPDQGVAVKVVVVEDPDEGDSPAEVQNSVVDTALDGDTNPIIRDLVIGAIAWNENPAKSVAVINSRLVHEGEKVDDVRALAIGQDYILLEYAGEQYRRSLDR